MGGRGRRPRLPRRLSQQSPASRWRRCGENTAAVTCFSFYANKTITTGEGGMAVTDDDQLAERMRQMSLHGLSHDAWKRYGGNSAWDYRIVAAGFKYNLTDIAAAIGIRQLRRAEEMRRQREAIARDFRRALADAEQIELPPEPPDRIHSWHLFPIRLKLDRLAIDRNAFIEEIRRRGVGCSVHWRPLHLHPYYEETFGWRAGASAGRLGPVDENHQPAAVSGNDDGRAGIRGARCQRDGFCHAFQEEMRRITEVRPATYDDIEDIARIHKARFGGPEYTLGQYSYSLVRGFYASFLGRCVFLVHCSDCGVDGFVVGGAPAEVSAAQRAFVRNNLVGCCLETLLHPRLWRAAYQFVRRSYLPQPTKFVEILAPDLPKLLSIAVDEAAQGSGAGAALVKAFESSISPRYAGYTLSVLKGNAQAVRFYEKLGLTIVVDAFPRSFIFYKEFGPSGDCDQQEP